MSAPATGDLLQIDRVNLRQHISACAHQRTQRPSAQIQLDPFVASAPTKTTQLTLAGDRIYHF